jgi:hypothetical protein
MFVMCGRLLLGGYKWNLCLQDVVVLSRLVDSGYLGTMEKMTYFDIYGNPADPLQGSGITPPDKTYPRATSVEFRERCTGSTPMSFIPPLQYVGFAN